MDDEPRGLTARRLHLRLRQPVRTRDTKFVEGPRADLRRLNARSVCSHTVDIFLGPFLTMPESVDDAGLLLQTSSSRT